MPELLSDRAQQRLANAFAAGGAAETMTERIPLKKMAKKKAKRRAAAGAAAETMTERIPIKKLTKRKTGGKVKI